MPFGTACNKLRKSVMFQLVQQTNRDVCFVCEEKIASPDEFTIEHKVSWLDNNTDLFWDLDNIAFSHPKCNKPDVSRRGRKIGPKGTAWCYSCKDFKSHAEFDKNISNWNGLDSGCKRCKYDRVSRSDWYKWKRK